MTGFFQSNPIGRIWNRFSKDIGNTEGGRHLLPMTFFDMIGIFLNVAAILVIVGVVNLILLAPSAAMFIIFYFLRSYYLKTARRVRGLERVARSPVFSHLSTSLYGLTTIRSFGAEKEFCKQFDEHQDMHTSSYFLLICTMRWFGILLDWLSVAYIATVAFSFMLFSNDGAQVGLAVSSALMLTGMFQFGVRQSAEVENQMVGVERVLEYTEIGPESPLESTDDKRPPKDWPTEGEIVMKKVQLKYGENVPVIRDVTCVFKSKEKIGIVGRTGAGKSSLITALFRVTEPTGEIEIDGVNVLEIGLHDLRSKMSIIPQDPVLFTGSLRKNLDPFNTYTDEEIWRVLEEVHLADEVRQTAAGLIVDVAEGGSNFSVGQRQLVCLGRAILRKNKILVLDEATANVDPETDALIQKTIRTKFLDCTVLTVAHRLHTVMDSDKILVLDAGTVKEYDEPYILLQSKGSSLYSLVQQTGTATADNLYKIAKEAHLKRRDIVVLSGDGT